jgi:hypothetical protein
MSDFLTSRFNGWKNASDPVWESLRDGSFLILYDRKKIRKIRAFVVYHL